RDFHVTGVQTCALPILLLLCPIWGLQQVAIKAIALDVPPALQVTLRSGIAALLVLLLSRIAKSEQWLLHIGWRPGVIIGALFARSEERRVGEEGGARWP